MRNFLTYIIAVFIPIALFLGIGEYLVRQVPNPYKYKEEWMEKHQQEVETLILGGSQTFYGVKPNLISGKAFNLANVSQGLRYDYFFLKKFYCPNLKTIIIPISYPTMYGRDLEKGKEWYRAIFYKIYMDYPAHSDYSRYNFEFTNFRTFKGKLTKYFDQSNDYGCDKWGWGNTYLLSKKNLAKWNDGSEAKKAEERHTRRDWDDALIWAEENKSFLKEIAEECEKRGIKLVLITTPCWKSYVSLLSKRQMNNTREIIQQLQNQYHIQYLDYLQDSRFVDSDFYDSNHLSEIGAAKFSRILNGDI